MTSAPIRKLRPRTTSRLLLFALIGAMLALYACYPGGATNVSDLDLVITLFDDTFDFQSQSTYSMPDSLVSFPDSTATVDTTAQRIILNAIKANMARYGYTLIASPDPGNQPDLLILPTAFSQDFAAWVSYPWYGYWDWWGGWGYYPPGWGPGWGWGYPPSGTVYEYTVGTVVLSMMRAVPDAGQAADMEVQGVWGAGIAGLATGSDEDRIEDLIKRAYDQSPYLDTN